jgi:TM2 domain-containing membrane protein YozV
MSAPQQPGYNAPAQGKSRVVAGLLNLFLGGFGIGDFYLGYTQYAIYKIVISLVLVVPTVVVDLGFISTIFSALYYAWGVVLLVVAIMTFLGKWIYEKDAYGVPTV